ncbi:helix-turn-helix domain-containing protein [Luteimonas sp. RD2P54]|uniref:Helix-turn-helix domain-containing protein n=1 Tax=Luteimonas endophytica TaxID=3042023 RepID=A0ABT6JDT1_9GAMM|nr:helix-turn-helix domain-containing protein [Luteimonas endophytica]MDH5824988.1 helix-turn-helix domain-containing protein [Luteimonas endophytica]
MHTRPYRHRAGPAAAAPALAALLVHESDRDLPRVAIPRPNIQLVVRIGPSARDGLDAHALGIRQQAHRKVVPGGQRAVFARLHLSTHQAALGAPGAALAGRVVALEDLWGEAAARRLRERLAGARDTAAAAAMLERAIAERIAAAPAPGSHARLAAEAAARLADGSVRSVACALGVSERHLRRIFRETVGVSPKAFARLARFHRALSAARRDGTTHWAAIAAAAGYFDQAHLIAEFHAIAGATPRALLAELRAAG